MHLARQNLDWSEQVEKVLGSQTKHYHTVATQRSIPSEVFRSDPQRVYTSTPKVWPAGVFQWPFLDTACLAIPFQHQRNNSQEGFRGPSDSTPMSSLQHPSKGTQQDTFTAGDRCHQSAYRKNASPQSILNCSLRNWNQRTGAGWKWQHLKLDDGLAFHLDALVHTDRTSAVVD